MDREFEYFRVGEIGRSASLLKKQNIKLLVFLEADNAN